MSSLDARAHAAVESAIQRFGQEPGPLLVVLHAVQDALGHIPPAAIPEIAAGLNLSRAEVHGVVTFYHYFRTSPQGRRVVQVCRAEACQARGGAALEAHAQARLGVAFDETSADGAVTLEAVYCLGNCATGPSVRIDGRMHGNVTPERFDALTARRGAQ
ncbi:MAG TPA: formate dehydrogenase subunit gamma [Steroidobacteraceae bacterium]|nr:formate dehydrogenase subunit gamma [Steroidobacteraceae bacterium]